METTTEELVVQPQAVPAPNSQTPSREHLFSGPFDLIAYLLMQLRMKLEEKDTYGNPTYIRVLNINNEDQPIEGITKIVEQAVGYFSYFVSQLHHLTLQAQEVLNQVDSFKTIYGVQIRLANEFIEHTDVIAKFFTAMLGQDNKQIGTFVSDSYKDALTQMEEGLEAIPAPEDLGRIGEEIYRLIAIVHKMDGEYRLPDQTKTGKIRMVHWSFNWEEVSGIKDLLWPVKYTDKDSKVFKFGKNGLLDSASRNPKTFNYFYEDQQYNKKVRIYTYDKDKDKDNDLKEVVDLLKTLGYITGEVTAYFGKDAGKVRNALLSFQFTNDLPMTGKVDNDTMNRLLNLDYEGRNIKRAKSGKNIIFDKDTTYGGYLGLINPDADGYSDEQITLIDQKGTYSYYRLGEGQNSKWMIAKEGEVPTHWENLKFIPGFVALESRLVDPNREDDAKPIYKDGKWAEGQSAGGRFFFAARHTEPWVGGRDNTPVDSIYGENLTLSEAKKSHGRISRMYQDIVINKNSEAFQNLLKAKKDYTLKLQASCMRRSLYNEKTYKTLPDQGRIGIEVYTKGTTGKPKILPELGKDDMLAGAKDGWLPNSYISGLRTDREVDQKSFWFLQKSKEIAFTTDDPAGDKKIKIDPSKDSLIIRVILDGRFNGGWDIDAYFDDVKVRWDLVKK